MVTHFYTKMPRLEERTQATTILHFLSLPRTPNSRMVEAGHRDTLGMTGAQETDFHFISVICVSAI